MAKIQSTLFLDKLQSEAKLQTQLYSHRLLPARLDGVTSLIGRYPWQSILLVSFMTSLITEMLRWGWWH